MAERSSDASTRGMKGKGFYDAHSEYQRRVIEGGDPLIRDTAGSLPDPPEGQVLTVADYGAGTGATSVHAVGVALDALRSIVGEDLEAGHCLVVEDSLAGVQSAKAAGMWSVGVAHTYTPEELRAAGADVVLDGLARLDPDWVERVFAPEISP